MLKELLLIHPMGQAAAFIFGAFNLITGWTRRCFLLPLHINIGVMFYALTCIGAAMGFLVSRRAASDCMKDTSTVHGFLAIVLIAVLMCAMLSGFLLLRKKDSRTLMLAIHRYCNLAVLVLFVLQAVSGLRILVSVW